MADELIAWRAMLEERDSGAPFLLFDDARAGGRARLFSSPMAIFEANRLDEVRPLLDRVRAEIATGRWCAGFLTYEAGLALERRMGDLARSESSAPLAWFAAFDAPREFELDLGGQCLLCEPSEALDPDPVLTAAEYRSDCREVLRFIGQGDIYQMNLTFQSALPPLSLSTYRRLRGRQKAAYGAIVSTGAQTHFSFSPELFFQLRKRQIITRPMKGTASRGADGTSDEDAKKFLQTDPKNRAENLMIVDLMRNDLARIAIPGSVSVPRLFEIETYPTLHQMTSTVTATLCEGLDAVSVIEALFPCGSITGAPKLRAMELIRAIEREPRGLYTGSIGWIAPDGDALFNVAIRTVTMNGSGRASFGLGSGVVADSKPEEEWLECLQKAQFLRDLKPVAFSPEAVTSSGNDSEFGDCSGSSKRR